MNRTLFERQISSFLLKEAGKSRKNLLRLGKSFVHKIICFSERVFTSWLIILLQLLQLEKTTIIHGIFIFSKIADKFQITDDILAMVVMTSLFIAMKINDDYNYTSLEFSKLTGCCVLSLIKAEHVVLEYFDFRLLIRSDEYTHILDSIQKTS